MGDIFSSFFGGRNRQPQGPEPGSTVRCNIQVSIEDIFNGDTRTLEVKVNKRCPDCNGTGGETETCSHCHGTGMITQTQRTPFGVIQNSHPCPHCQGTGTKFKKHCATCHTSGFVQGAETIKVHIRPGIANGETITFSGQGYESKDPRGKTGDLIITIKVIQKNIFKYESGIAILEVPITPYEALLGASITIPTPAGNTTIKIPPQTNSGDKFKILNSGVSQNGTGKRSELLVIAKICTPQKPSIETIKKYKELKELDTEDVRKELFE